MSCVTCHMLPATRHLSLTPTATATDAPPANLPTMHGRLVCNHPKKVKKSKRKKNHSNLPKIKRSLDWPMLAILSSIRGLQSTGNRGFQKRTNCTQTIGHGNLWTESF